MKYAQEKEWEKKKEEYFKKKREKQKERLKKFGDSHKVKPLKYGNTN